MIKKIETIYVKLLNEDITVYRPVKALQMNNEEYKIVEKNQELNEKFGEIWEFNLNDIVKVKKIKGIKRAINNLV